MIISFAILIFLFIMEVICLNNAFEKCSRIPWIVLSVAFYIGISEYVYIIIYTMPIF